jgi:hypothetical protein
LTKAKKVDLLKEEKRLNIVTSRFVTKVDLI